MSNQQTNNIEEVKINSHAYLSGNNLKIECYRYLGIYNHIPRIIHWVSNPDKFNSLPPYTQECKIYAKLFELNIVNTDDDICAIYTITPDKYMNSSHMHVIYMYQGNKKKFITVDSAQSNKSLLTMVEIYRRKYERGLTSMIKFNYDTDGIEYGRYLISTKVSIPSEVLYTDVIQVSVQDINDGHPDGDDSNPIPSVVCNVESVNGIMYVFTYDYEEDEYGAPIPRRETR
jgi:hypothetical protein